MTETKKWLSGNYPNVTELFVNKDDYPEVTV
jgi:hypothetical protein